MSDYYFIRNPNTKKWVISAPKREQRPDVAKGGKSVDPFCPGNETAAPLEVYRIGRGGPMSKDWDVRVIPNKFPFAPTHEIIIHSPDHNKNFDELPLAHVRKILQVYRFRFQTHCKAGFVYIFHNHGRSGGESIPHPHTQLAVLPFKLPVLAEQLGVVDNEIVRTKFFQVFAPLYSAWPYEVWVAPEKRGRLFGDLEDDELEEFSEIIQKVLITLRKKYGKEFPFNFYIYPSKDWYWRVIPRVKTIGGFELSSQIFVNSTDPEEVRTYLRKNLEL